MDKQTKIALMKKAYMFVYREFGADTKEIMEELQIQRTQAMEIMNSLESIGLSYGEFTNGRGLFLPRTAESRKRTVGVSIMWQNYQTYDSIDEAEANALFDQAVEKFMVVL